MSKVRRVRIQLNFLCDTRAEAGSAISRVATFISGEAAGSTYNYSEAKSHEDEIRLSIEMRIFVDDKSDDDTIETKLDNNLSFFPALYPGTEPGFYYMADGVAD